MENWQNFSNGVQHKLLIYWLQSCVMKNYISSEKWMMVCMCVVINYTVHKLISILRNSLSPNHFTIKINTFPVKISSISCVAEKLSHKNLAERSCNNFVIYEHDIVFIINIRLYINISDSVSIVDNKIRIDLSVFQSSNLLCKTFSFWLFYSAEYIIGTEIELW